MSKCKNTKTFSPKSRALPSQKKAHRTPALAKMTTASHSALKWRNEKKSSNQCHQSRPILRSLTKAAYTKTPKRRSFCQQSPRRLGASRPMSNQLSSLILVATKGQAMKLTLSSMTLWFHSQTSKLTAIKRPHHSWKTLQIKLQTTLRTYYRACKSRPSLSPKMTKKTRIVQTNNSSASLAKFQWQTCL